MFSKINHTSYPPLSKPLMIWDGECGFCHYWIIRWWIMSGDVIEYQKYQLANKRVKDISIDQYKEAVRLVLPDGKVYSGPDAAYKAFQLAGKYTFLTKWYAEKEWFQKLSDWGYQKVADHRYRLFEWTKRLFGKNPRTPKKHWINYLFALMVISLGLLVLTLFVIKSL